MYNFRIKLEKCKWCIVFFWPARWVLYTRI